MSTWLKLLPIELDGLSSADFIEPPHRDIKDDKVVGLMSEDCKRLWTLHILLEKVSQQYRLDAHYCRDEAEKEKLETKAVECAEKAHAMLAIMWIAIRDEFEIWNRTIGIRVGYKVVTNSEPSNDMPPSIKRLLGLE